MYVLCDVFTHHHSRIPHPTKSKRFLCQNRSQHTMYSLTVTRKPSITSLSPSFLLLFTRLWPKPRAGLKRDVYLTHQKSPLLMNLSVSVFDLFVVALEEECMHSSRSDVKKGRGCWKVILFWVWQLCHLTLLKLFGKVSQQWQLDHNIMSANTTVWLLNKFSNFMIMIINQIELAQWSNYQLRHN